MKRLFTIFPSLLTQGARVQKTKMMYVVMAIVMMVLMPHKASAKEMTYDFATLATKAHNLNPSAGWNYNFAINSGESYSIANTKYGATTFYTDDQGSCTVDFSRFAFRMNDANGGWALRYTDESFRGLNFIGGTVPQLAIVNLRPDDVITIYYHTISGSNRLANITFESGSAKWNVNGTETPIAANTSLGSTNQTSDQTITFTATAKGDIVLTTTGSSLHTFISKIVITRPDVGSYDYHPTNYEVYDFYRLENVSVTGENNNSNLTDADFNLDWNDYSAKYVHNLSDLVLNNRLAISQVEYNGLYTPWQFSNSGLQSIGNWHNLSISNLNEGDRVRITYFGQAVFSSKSSSAGGDKPHQAYNGVSAFKDTWNDGEFNASEGDANISLGMTVEPSDSWTDGNYNETINQSYYYVITGNGHLDIALAAGSRLVKIEIYSDHKAQMVDKYNGSAVTGYTSYFNVTGQLEAKEHIVPGGLEVHIGNEAVTEHAIVTMTDQGYASYVYDYDEYKMARNGQGTNLMAALPNTGTYYKFIPEVNGTMIVRYKANSIRYYNYYSKGSNEVYHDGGMVNNQYFTTGSCPYYLMVQSGNNTSFSVVGNDQVTYKVNGQANSTTSGNITLGNDVIVTASLHLTSGNVYYLYGWWNGNDFLQSDCGLAELIDVTFIPDQMVTPLAKWVANTNWVESSTYVEELADVTGFSDDDIHIKMLSASIDECTPSIEGNDTDGYKLKITGVKFKEGKNPGGTILIKLGDPSNDANPVFAYTIAYDASFNMPEGAARSEGHTWDFSTNSLNGMKWDTTNSKFVVKDFSTADDEDGLLYAEMHEAGGHSDWTKTWRVIDHTGTGTHDLMFVNKYSMEGDNADMIWETEGLIFNTSSNQSCINNEFGGEVDHSKFGTENDPDRYVGILPGGSFTIPALKKGDRVEIFMGSGDGSGSNACKFNITGACDAIGKTISSSDIYNAGGSPWEYNKGNESRYRGAYQFISQGGDMTFTMNGGSMTKLYSITIYRGTKTSTVDASRPNYSTTYDGKEYQPLYQYNNDYRTSATESQRGYLTIHYRGKGERLRTPTVVYKSGNIDTDADHLFYAEIGSNNAPFIFFKSEKQQYGMFRMRIDDLELNNNYVADYALQNISVGYLQNKTYPYTWDFTDIKGYIESNIQAERTKVGKYGVQEVITNVSPKTLDGTNYIEFMNNTVGENVKAVEQWKSYAADGDIPAGYGLQINNEPYSGGVMWNEGQLYGGNDIFAESFGLSIKVPEYVDDKGKIQPEVNKNHNGGVRICDEGLCLTGGNWTIMIPEVATNKAVYVRAKQVGKNTIYAAVGDVLNNTSFTYVGEANDVTKDKIYAVMGTGEDLKLMFNNLIIKKIAISEDPKTVNHLGYATESRNQEIDPELMGYMTGTGLKAYTITEVNYGKNAGDIPSITLTEILPANVMGPAGPTSEKDHRAYIIYNTDDAVTAPTGTAADAMDANGKTKAVNILGGGFHLFYPDMHDRSNAAGAKKSMLKTEVKEGGKNYLRSHITSGDIDPTEDDYTNYLMNYKYYDRWGRQQKGPEAFYRAGEGARLGDNKAYLQLETDKVRPENYNGAKQGFAIIFVNEEKGITTTVLDGVKTTEMHINDDAIYTLSGMKVNNPQKGGIYVKNGKKIVIK